MYVDDKKADIPIRSCGADGIRFNMPAGLFIIQ